MKITPSYSSIFEISDDKWLSTKDVAKFLSTSPNAVRIMVCRGILVAHRIGGRLKFRKSDCSTLLKKRS